MSKTSHRRARAKLPKFKPALTQEQVRQIEANYNETWGVRRRLVLFTLTRTPTQLAEGFRDADSETFMELVKGLDAFKEHCKDGAKLADSAHARMLAIGLYIAENYEGAMS